MVKNHSTHFLGFFYAKKILFQNTRKIFFRQVIKYYLILFIMVRRILELVIKILNLIEESMLNLSLI